MNEIYRIITGVFVYFVPRAKLLNVRVSIVFLKCMQEIIKSFKNQMQV